VRRRLRVALATSNPGKLREIRAILSDLPVEWLEPGVLPPVRLPEEGDDYAANARAKARAVAEQTGEWALADDSGIEVDALGGAPGPRSARFGGPDLDDAGRVRALLDAVARSGRRERGARFVCVAALAGPAGELVTSRGEVAGELLQAPRGSGGFGYDPIFRVAGRGETMAELPEAEKNQISHRARALAGLRAPLQTRSAALRSFK
jgi:XTP/dITP diphosphohydrolase